MCIEAGTDSKIKESPCNHGVSCLSPRKGPRNWYVVVAKDFAPDVETEAQTGMSVLQVVMAERFPGPSSLLPVKRGVQLWGGFSDVFLSSVTSLESRRSLAR